MAAPVMNLRRLGERRSGWRSGGGALSRSTGGGDVGRPPPPELPVAGRGVSCDAPRPYGLLSRPTRPPHRPLPLGAGGRTRRGLILSPCGGCCGGSWLASDGYQAGGCLQGRCLMLFGGVYVTDHCPPGDPSHMMQQSERETPPRSPDQSHRNMAQ